MTVTQFPSPPAAKSAVLSLAEKTIATYLQALIVALLGSTFFESLDWSVAEAAAISSIPAAITVIANAPNPAGQALLARFFGGAIIPLYLAAAALLPTAIAVICYRVIP